MTDKKELEQAIQDVQEAMIGEQPEGEYETGVRDGCQHAIVCVRDMMGND